jgi:tetratricopeptide (TPR) repeat protein
MPPKNLAHRVMDKIQETKRRASTLEARGDDAQALEIYSSIPLDRMDASLLALTSAVQARLGRTGPAVESRTRAADLLAQNGYPNAALASYRMVLRIDPSEYRTYLTIGRVAGGAGYQKDAIAAFKSYLQSSPAADLQLDDLMQALEEIRPDVRSAVIEEIRDPLLALDDSRGDALQSLLEESLDQSGEEIDSLPGLESLVEPEGLLATSRAGLEDSIEIPALEGLETHQHDALNVDAPDDIPLLEMTRGTGDHAATEFEPFELETIAPLESEDEDHESDPLPLLGMDGDEENVEASIFNSPPEDDGFVDFGALVLGDSDLGDDLNFVGSGGASTGSDDADEDFSDLLLKLGARPSGASEDVGSHYDLGLAYKEMGLLDSAIAQLHDSLAAGTNTLASLEVLGECYLERSELARADLVLRRAMQLAAAERDLIGVHYLLGRCEEESGSIEAARALYTRVVAVEPEFRDAAGRLGRL